MIKNERIAEDNERQATDLNRDYEALAEKLNRKNIDIRDLTATASQLTVALPSWGVAPAALGNILGAFFLVALPFWAANIAAGAFGPAG
jgi:L-rhamnose isomerase